MNLTPTPTPNPNPCLCRHRTNNAQDFCQPDGKRREGENLTKFSKKTVDRRIHKAEFCLSEGTGGEQKALATDKIYVKIPLPDERKKKRV